MIFQVRPDGYENRFENFCERLCIYEIIAQFQESRVIKGGIHQAE
jgi:hypothetical protein